MAIKYSSEYDLMRYVRIIVIIPDPIVCRSVPRNVVGGIVRRQAISAASG